MTDSLRLGSGYWLKICCRHKTIHVPELFQTFNVPWWKDWKKFDSSISEISSYLKLYDFTVHQHPSQLQEQKIFIWEEMGSKRMPGWSRVQPSQLTVRGWRTCQTSKYAPVILCKSLTNNNKISTETLISNVVLSGKSCNFFNRVQHNTEVVDWLEERHLFSDKRVILSHTLNPFFSVGRELVSFRDMCLLLMCLLDHIFVFRLSCVRSVLKPTVALWRVFLWTGVDESPFLSQTELDLTLASAQTGGAAHEWKPREHEPAELELQQQCLTARLIFTTGKHPSRLWIPP